MGRAKHWNNVPGTASVEVVVNNLGEWADGDTGDVLPKELAAWLEAAYPAEEPDGFGLNLTIEFTSTGYDDPGSIGGHPDNAYPPEGEDEREITRVTVDASPEVELPESLHAAVWKAFGEDVASAEIAAADYAEDR